MTRRTWYVLATLTALASAAHADPRREATDPRREAIVAAAIPAGLPLAGVRVGAHAGFARVVIDLPPGASAATRNEPGGLRVMLVGASWPVTLPDPPPPWRAVERSGDDLLLRLRLGAVARTRQMEGRLVLDAATAPASAPLSAPFSAPPPAVFTPAPSLPVASVALAPPAGAPVAAPAAAHAAPTAPPAIAAPAITNPPPPAEPPAATPAAGERAVTEQPARFVAAPPDVAAAAFTRAGMGYVVFDAVVTPDLAGVPGAYPIPLEGAVAVAAPLPFAVHPVTGGWALGAADTASPLSFHTGPGGGLIAALPGAAVAGRVVTMPDPEGDGLLLVGTLRPADALPEAQVAATPAAQATPDADVLPTVRGVVVAAVSDAVTLRATRAGWVLAIEGEGRVSAADNAIPSDRIAAAVAAAGLTRCLDLPDLPTAALLRRLQVAQDAAAVAPAGDRATPRLKVAAAMVALGLGVEAAGQVSLALADDPRARATAEAQLLGLAAAVLSHRPAPETPAADATCRPEATLWHHAASPVSSVAGDLGLLRSYPTLLRHHLLPAMAEALATGEPAGVALRALLAGDADGALDYARALAEPDAARALAALDAVAAGRDPALHVRAARLAIERRLAAGTIDAHRAADAMEPLVVAWRGDASEVDLRLRIAALRAQSGGWRPALAMLRETAMLVDPGLNGAGPGGDGMAARVADRARATFDDALAADAKLPLPPLELIALAEENAALLPADAAGVALAERLADRLASLDLPDRATQALATLAHAARPGAPRAALGERLGGLRLAAGDAAGALAALADSNAAGLPAPVEARRTLLWARATAVGDPAAALLALQNREDDPAMALRADLLERQALWPEATRTLAAIAAKAMPATGPLDGAAVATVLRWASAAARASDETTLQDLRETVLARLPAGPQADLLRVLTAAPVRELADLPRAGREAALARTTVAR